MLNKCFFIILSWFTINFHNIVKNTKESFYSHYYVIFNLVVKSISVNEVIDFM